MIGIKYRIERDSEEGPVDKQLLLATSRYGAGGDAMRAAKKANRKAVFELLKASKRVALLDRRLAEMTAGDTEFNILQAESDAALEAVQDNTEAAMEHARKLVCLSLTENYGRETAEELVGELTERDLQGCLETIETGEQPEDFFPKGDRLAKSSATSPSDESSTESLLNTASQPDK